MDNKYKLVLTSWSFRNLDPKGRELAQAANLHKLHEEHLKKLLSRECSKCGVSGAERNYDHPDGHIRILCPNCDKGIK